MSKPICPRAWEVEASRDGRLSDVELAKFAEHHARCVGCQTETAQLDAVMRAVRRAAPQQLDALSLLRLRRRVLEAANDTLTNAGSSPRSPRWIAMALGLAVASAFVVTLRQRRAVLIPTGQNALQVAPLPSVAVQPAEETTWRDQPGRDERRLVLSSGTLRIAVSRRPGDRRVVVEVPDGEIEDEGTRFLVTVAREATTLIRVEQGKVVFRRSDGATVAVLAGESWHAESRDSSPTGPKPAQSAAGASNPANPTVAALLDGPRQPVFRDRLRVPHQGQKSGPAASASAAILAPAGADEDLAYLELLALVKEGRPAEARLAANSYLARFPSGFRRVEVLAISNQR